MQPGELEANREVAARADTVAVWAALDLSAWRLIRFTLSSAPAEPARGGEVYDVMHLAQAGLNGLK